MPPHLLTAHTGSHGETGAFWMGGGITTLGAFCAVRKPCVAGCQNGKLCRFWVLAGCTPKERRKPSEQRCVHARRCPEASRPRWDALLCCWFLRYTGKLRGSLSLHPRAERKICCWGCLVFACGVGNSSLVTAVRFLNRCSRRSMRGTCPLEQRSDCRF